MTDTQLVVAFNMLKKSVESTGQKSHYPPAIYKHHAIHL